MSWPITQNLHIGEANEQEVEPGFKPSKPAPKLSNTQPMRDVSLSNQHSAARMNHTV